MGNWGIKALESDSGLDVIYFLEGLYLGKTKMALSEIIAECRKAGFLGQDRDAIYYLYDNTILAIAELFLMFRENGFLAYDNEDKEKALKLKTHFEADKKSFEYIYQQLLDIKQERPDSDGERELVTLWRRSDLYEDWKTHLDYLIFELKQLKQDERTNSKH